MTWFKVDDKFWSNRKVRPVSSLALGVWIRVGSYCAHEENDGTIDMATVYWLCPDPARTVDRAVAELLAAGLWETTDGDRHMFHDWTDHQPTKAELEAAREASRERQRRARERRAQERAAAEPDQAPVAPAQARDRRRE